VEAALGGAIDGAGRNRQPANRAATRVRIKPRPCFLVPWIVHVCWVPGHLKAVCFHSHGPADREARWEPPNLQGSRLYCGFPLLRTLQLAAWIGPDPPAAHQLCFRGEGRTWLRKELRDALADSLASPFPAPGRAQFTPFFDQSLV